MPRVATIPLFALVGSLGCPADDGGQSGGSADTSAGETSGGSTTGDGETPPQTGMLQCPTGESCTLVVAAEALDDRIDVFAARGPGPVFRGSIAMDFKPNPMGDNAGEYLDEPFGMVLDAGGLHTLVGHYPMRQAGSLVTLPHALFAGLEPGTRAPTSTIFDGTAFTDGVVYTPLMEQEPIFVVRHRSGRLLVGVFANDLFALETEWTNPGALLVIDPADPASFGVRSLATVGQGSCAGAWSVVWLDDGDTVALGCDGDEGVAVLDVSGVGEGSPADAAAAIDGCLADIPFADKRVRYVAPDGAGGLLVAEGSPVFSQDDGRLWRFDGACKAIGAFGSFPGEFFEIRQIVRWPTTGEPRWFMPSGRAPSRGIHVVRDGAAGPEVCATLDDLDTWWTTDDGGDAHPYALALDRAGTGMAVGAGPPEAPDDMPADSRVLWLELDPSVDPCTGSPVTSAVDLAAMAPAVDAADPDTWRRGPNVVLVHEYP